jgi:hypothetical protein
MAAGPAAVALGVTGVAWFIADRAAARRFYSGFARNVGLGYASRFELLSLTPLLGAGSRRRAEHWMYGQLPGDLPGGVGHFVWERIERDSDGDERVGERNRFTICVADLELKAGALVVFVPHAVEDAGILTYLIDATRHVASRVLAEVEEDRLRAA